MGARGHILGRLVIIYLCLLSAVLYGETGAFHPYDTLSYFATTAGHRGHALSGPLQNPAQLTTTDIAGIRVWNEKPLWGYSTLQAESAWSDSHLGLGVGVQYWGAEDLVETAEGTNGRPMSVSHFGHRLWTFAMSGASLLFPNLSVGATGVWLGETIAGNTGQFLGVDLGVRWQLYNPFYLGGMTRQLLGKTLGSTLPTQRRWLIEGGWLADNHQGQLITDLESAKASLQLQLVPQFHLISDIVFVLPLTLSRWGCGVVVKVYEFECFFQQQTTLLSGQAYSKMVTGLGFYW